MASNGTGPFPTVPPPSLPPPPPSPPNEPVNDLEAWQMFYMRMQHYVSYGLALVQGRHGETTDAVMAVPWFSPLSSTYDFFGVYDGHFGAMVANYLRVRLHVAISDEMLRDLWRNEPQFGHANLTQWWQWAMCDAFAAVDNEIVRHGVLGTAVDVGLVGATALVAVVVNTYIVLGNCGNSRAVMSRNGMAIRLTVEHRPTRSNEKQRVEAAGGRVDQSSDKVDNIIPTSRAFGSAQYKRYIIAEPEVVAVGRTPEDEFLILATDGLWDFVTPALACNYVRQSMKRLYLDMVVVTANTDVPMVVANMLANFARRLGSDDDIGIVIVVLRNFWGPRNI